MHKNMKLLVVASKSPFKQTAQAWDIHSFIKCLNEILNAVFFKLLWTLWS